jgi:hypothetical protein
MSSGYVRTTAPKRVRGGRSGIVLGVCWEYHACCRCASSYYAGKVRCCDAQLSRGSRTLTPGLFTRVALRTPREFLGRTT